MLVAPVADRGLNALLPSTTGRARTAPTPALVLEIGDDGLLLNRMPVASLEALRDRLSDSLRTRGDRTVFVQVSGGVTYGSVVTALDVAKASGAERIGLLNPPPASQ